MYHCSSLQPGSVDLSLDVDGGHYASQHVTIPKGMYEGQLVVGDSFVHPVKEFTIDRDGIVVLQFESSHKHEGMCYEELAALWWPPNHSSHDFSPNN